MSSHHFVKEGQEPTVWVLGNQYQEEVLGQLLEWSPTVVTTNDAIEKLFSLQIKIDKVFTENNNQQEQEFYTAHYPMEWVTTDLIQNELIEDLATKRTVVYVVGLHPTLLQELIDTIPKKLLGYVVGVSKNEKWVCPTKKWSKWLAKDSKFRLTGSMDDWEIKGAVTQQEGDFISKEDQLLLLENTRHNFFIEYLPCYS